MTDRWVLVPFLSGPDTDQLVDVAHRIPRAIWDAMVERGARAICQGIHEDPDEMWWTLARNEHHPAWMAYIPEATNALRAFLNGQKVEDDE